MPFFTVISNWFKGRRIPVLEPAKAYDKWANAYDHQPGNLMLATDEWLFLEWLDRTHVENKWLGDIGCGTGRHWNQIYNRNPGKLVGFDVSEGMLAELSKKFPQAETVLIRNDELAETQNEIFDYIISTLAIAHIKDLNMALAEWNRVLKPGGEIYLSDFHPEVLSRGGQRTFREGTQTISVENHIHPLHVVVDAFRQLHFDLIRLTEKKIDESVKQWYSDQHALDVYEQFYGLPFIYCLHLKKSDASS